MPEIAGTNFSATATHATKAEATQAAPGAGKRFLVTDIAGSSDLAGAILRIIEDTGGTPVVKFQLQLVANGNFSHSFKTPIEITANKTVTLETTGTSACKANISGKIISN